MRRVLSPAVERLVQRWRSIAGRWNSFWFTPADPTMLGLIRVLTGLMLVYTHAVWGLELEAFFGSDGWLSEEAVRALQSDQFVFSYWWYIPPDWMWLAHGAALAVLGFFAIGLCTQVTSVLAFVITVSYAHRVPAALFGLDQINALLTLYLAIGPSGQALSLDRLLAGYWASRRPSAQSRFRPEPPASLRANLALRLIQVHMCVIYFFAGISKLQGPSWWNGEAMWMAFANLEYQSADMTWLANFPWIINVMSLFVPVWEISFCILVWKPSWRPLVLFCAVVTHVGIGACMGMWTFGLIMLVGCTSFVPTESVRALLNALKGMRKSKPATVAYIQTTAQDALRHPAGIADQRQLQVRVSPQALGILAWSEDAEKLGIQILIPKNTPLPAKAKYVFGTVRDNQKNARIRLVEGDPNDGELLKSVGWLRIGGLPQGLPAGSQIRVRLAYTAGGQIQVTAKERKSGRLATAQFYRPPVSRGMPQLPADAKQSSPDDERLTRLQDQLEAEQAARQKLEQRVGIGLAALEQVQAQLSESETKFRVTQPNNSNSSGSVPSIASSNDPVAK